MDSASDFSDYVYESGSDIDGNASSGGNYMGFEPKASLTSPRRGCAWSKEYSILETADLKTRVSEEQEKVSTTLGVDSFQARLLLMHFSWNSEQVMNEFLSDGLEKVLEKAGGPLAPPTEPSDSMKVVEGPPPPPTSGPITCQVCMDDVTAYHTNWCGHTFCDDCWTGYLSVQISSAKSRRLKCMGFKCPVVCHEQLVKALCSAADYERYSTAQVNSYVDSNPRASWCRSVPHCGRFLELSPSTPRNLETECSCGELFCFKCGDGPHSPVPCDWFTEWNSKCQADSATAKFITSNCKPCPKCHKMIEKVSGCNHVRCVCGQCMCWLCGASVGMAHTMNSISGHTCGSYRTELEKNAADARKELDRYMHYFKRYDAHMNSLKMASNLRASVRKTIDTLEDLGAKSAAMSTAAPHADWLEVGLEQLLRMRQVLAFSFVFGYYAFAGPTHELLQQAQRERGVQDYHIQTLFEQIQARLDFSIETLSELVETPASHMNASIKAKVLQFANITHVNCKAMYDVIFSEIVSTGAISTSIAPYRPIRLMITGLGTTIDPGSENAESHALSPVAASKP